jgi:hypothetical protein
MAAHLTKKQREALLAWIGEGLESDEINKRAAKFKPAFKVTRANVERYRRTRQIELSTLKASGQYNALAQGLALKEERVKRLAELAERLWADLNGKRLWLEMVKSIGFGDNSEIVDYEEFNQAEVREFRGLLDDLAKEMGQRRTIVEVNRWEERAVIAIKAGEVDYSSVVEEFGPSLAKELFRKANVEIVEDDSISH